MLHRRRTFAIAKAGALVAAALGGTSIAKKFYNKDRAQVPETD
jgi:hypothetical protein